MTLSAFFRFCASAGILSALSMGGDFVSRALNLPVPGPILGMIVLLALLGFFPKLADWTAPAADLLLTWLGALIVPAAAGIILYTGIFSEYGVSLAAVLIITTLLTGLSVALIYKAVAK
jgi:holin-like protein